MSSFSLSGRHDITEEKHNSGQLEGKYNVNTGLSPDSGSGQGSMVLIEL